MRLADIAVAMAMVAAVDGNCAGGERILECGQNLMVRTPRVVLESGERVVGIELTILGGSVVRVDSIPRDWGVSVEPEVSGMASVRGNPAHGVGALNSTDELPSLIIRGHTCSGQPPFTVSAIVHLTRDFESTRTIDLGQGALTIQRAPNSTLQRSSTPCSLLVSASTQEPGARRRS